MGQFTGEQFASRGGTYLYGEKGPGATGAPCPWAAEAFFHTKKPEGFYFLHLTSGGCDCKTKSGPRRGAFVIRSMFLFSLQLALMRNDIMHDDIGYHFSSEKTS